MFNWKKKYDNVVDVTKLEREFEVVATVNFEEDLIGAYIELVVKFRIKGTENYKVRKHLVASRRCHSDSKFNEEGHKFMDNLEENIMKYAREFIETDIELMNEKDLGRELKNRVIHTLPYETTIKI